MANLAVWLIGLAVPLAKKVLIGLGIGWATYAGLTSLVNAVIGAVQANFGAMSGGVASMVSLFGFPEAAGITCGALVARVAIISAGHLTKMSS